MKLNFTTVFIVAVAALVSRTFGAVIVGQVSYDIDNDEIEINANEVLNNDSSESVSGTLELQVWAFTSPYEGAGQNGYILGTYSLGQLDYGDAFFDISGVVGYNYSGGGLPGNATYIVMMLNEYKNGGWVTDDVVPFYTLDTIHTQAEPPGAGTTSAGGTFKSGTDITLTATPNLGYEFVDWTFGGIVVGKSSSLSIDVTSSGTYVAHFAASGQTAAVTLQTSGLGRIAYSFNPAALKVGHYYTVTGVPDKGQLFSNWNGSISSTSAALKFEMQATNMVLQANFVANPFLVAGGLYDGLFYQAVENNSAIDSVTLGDCPIGISMDSPHRVVWVSAQCGSGNDPVWAIEADSDTVLAGPIGTGAEGIGPVVVNPATDRLYINAGNAGSKRVNPVANYALTTNAFGGMVMGANVSANLLYAYPWTNSVQYNNLLQIINGAPDPEVILTNVTLPFTTSGAFIGVNPSLNRIYVGSSGSNLVAVLDAINGKLLTTIPLGVGITSVGSIGVDASRDRAYADASGGGTNFLYVIQDAVTQPTIVTNIVLPGGGGLPRVNPGLNEIYISANNETVVVDGNVFSQRIVGSCWDVDVDAANNNYWTVGLYSPYAYVWSGRTVPIPSQAGAGYIQLTVSGDGQYSGKLLNAGSAYGLSGQFGINGATTKVLSQARPLPLTLEMQLDTSGVTGQLTGTVSSSMWSAPLVANRAETGVEAPQRGRYTMTFTPSSTNGSIPQGISIGTASVARNGMVQFSGILSDGTAISQSAVLSKDGAWPLYVSLDRGQGSILAWITLTNDAAGITASPCWWIKLPGAGNSYLSGFTNMLDFAASTYLYVAGQNLLNLSSGQMVLRGGGLTSEITNDFTMENNRIIVSSDSGENLRLSLVALNGMLRGSFVDPVTLHSTVIEGVVMQAQTNASGFFVSDGQSASMSLTGE